MEFRENITEAGFIRSDQISVSQTGAEDQDRHIKLLEEYRGIVSAQQAFFNSNRSKDVNFRISQLKKLKTILKENELSLNEAIYEDFGKSAYETYLTEMSHVYHELNLAMKKIPRWSRQKRVRTNLSNFPGHSRIMPEPLGVTLVIGAWNYPYLVSLGPVISSIAAGNTVILKPSELPLRTSNLMAKLINENFSPDFLHVIEGGVEETTALLENRFDKIFFTGSVPVGRIIYQAAARHLTPVTLEMGGKSPTFVMADCNLKLAAKRIAWAKFLNAGQTCLSPDYILVEKSIKEKFLAALKSEIDKYHGDKEDIDDNYLRIINTGNFDRLEKLIDKEKLCYGGRTNREKRFISPTLIDDVDFNDELMKDEIFGPILPLISFENLDEVIARVKQQAKPLSCYIYSNSKNTIRKILREVSFGGGTTNDSLVHFTNDKLPFGGVGLSGIGSAHGKTGFDSFTHFKGIVHKSPHYEPPLKYPPYTKGKQKLFRFLLE